VLFAITIFSMEAGGYHYAAISGRDRLAAL